MSQPHVFFVIIQACTGRFRDGCFVIKRGIWKSFRNISTHSWWPIKIDGLLSRSRAYTQEASVWSDCSNEATFFVRWSIKPQQRDMKQPQIGAEWLQGDIKWLQREAEFCIQKIHKIITETHKYHNGMQMMCKMIKNTQHLTQHFCKETQIDTKWLPRDAKWLQRDTEWLQSDTEWLQSDTEWLQSDKEWLQRDKKRLQRDNKVTMKRLWTTTKCKMTTRKKQSGYKETQSDYKETQVTTKIHKMATKLSYYLIHVWRYTFIIHSSRKPNHLTSL